MPATASGLAYATGFIVATALLHALGIGLGITIQRLARPQIVRFAGIAIALCGGYLLLS
jgi:urease accessory protein